MELELKNSQARRNHYIAILYFSPIQLVHAENYSLKPWRERKISGLWHMHKPELVLSILQLNSDELARLETGTGTSVVIH